MRWLVLMALTGYVASCGQQGPLVLPEEPQTRSLTVTNGQQS